MPSLIPTSSNAQYYANGRGLARYQGQKPLATDPAPGTPIWWSNEGVKDVWAGVPSRTGTETIWLDNGGGQRQVIGRIRDSHDGSPSQVDSPERGA